MESRETSVVTPNHLQQQQHHYHHQPNNTTTSGSTGQLSSSGGGSLSGASGVISGGGTTTTATGAGMHHSLSTPAGVDGGGGANGGTRTPPATPKKGGKMLAIRVQMLDDTITIFQVQAKAMGRVLFDQVCKQLHLLEADYFGLEYQDLSGTRYWLDLQKPISRQLGLSLVDPLLHFCVKFYTPDPGQLEEEYTRYLYCLQVKRDLAAPSTTSVSTQTGAGSGAAAAGGGCLQWCNDNTAALMASYIVQAECGDYVAEDYPDHTYLSSYKFVPHQDRDMERRIMENHKKHAGQSPAEADLNLLETARRCELYGVKMHPAKDHENVSLNLAVAHMGIVVFQHFTKINTFSWAKIRKISFKRKRFLIKLHPEGYGYYKDTVEFFFEGRNECKNFWKKCVENHGFFRCAAVKNISRHKTRVLSRGSSFRYSGKTQKQIVEFVRDNYVKRQTFQRSASFRHSSAHSSANNMHASTVGNSLSAHPLLPLADTNLSAEASKRSGSVGAMGENSPTTTTTLLPSVAPPPPFSETNAATTTTTTNSSAAADITMRNITAANTISNTGDNNNTTTAAAAGAASRTTRSVSHHHGTPMSWSTDRDIRKPIAPPAQTMSSPSPPLTMQSVSPITSTTTSPQHPPVSVTPPYANNNLDLPASPPSPAPPPPQHHTPVVAVLAAVHRADTTTDNHYSLGENNNMFFASTPINSKLNGTSAHNDSTLNTTHGSYSPRMMDGDGSSPLRNAANEQFMNSINANATAAAEAAAAGNNTTTIIAEIEGELKKRPSRYQTDRAFYIAKEILMTEITYKKDLDIINVAFRDEVGKEEPDESMMLLNLVASLANAHGLLVKDLEQRLQNWEGRGGANAGTGRVADILLTHLPPLLHIYEEYLDGHLLMLERLDVAFKQNNRFEQLYRDFETQKVCYLPITTLVLKPLHRILHYQTLLQRLLKHYGPSHPDRYDCHTAADTLADIIQPVTETLEHSENLATLCELQRDIAGFEQIVQAGRTFIRHGCLLKHSRKKGYQQRMFFLFSDILLYTSRSQVTLQFKVHGHMPLRGVLIESADGELAEFGFIIYGGNRALTVAASSREERDRWRADLQLAIQQARDTADAKVTYLSLKSCSSSDEIVDQCGTEVGTQTKSTTIQRSNTTVHVCWHRNTSISMKDQLVAVENQLSGYLLRKFKSSNGWQKLWVVFTSFCLFFYKGCADDSPLASLPLLGYSVGAPTIDDNIAKDFVFKLQYKNHVYFFRAESEYTYNRWLEVIGSATQGKPRRKEYINENTIESSPEK